MGDFNMPNERLPNFHLKLRIRGRDEYYFRRIPGLHDFSSRTS
jgi:hypothetical protein